VPAWVTVQDTPRPLRDQAGTESPPYEPRSQTW
jgi:hypothetical protein